MITTAATPAGVWSSVVESIDSMTEVELATYQAADREASKAVKGLDLPTFSPEWFRAFTKAWFSFVG